MSAFMIFENIEVFDMEAINRHRAEAPAIFESFGAKYLSAGGRVEMLEGNWKPQSLVIIEFPSMEAAKACYESEAYRELLELRLENSKGTGILVEGFQPGIPH